MNNQQKTKQHKKILAIASAGGHWTQLKMLSEAFKQQKVEYVTTTLNRSAVDDSAAVYFVLDADLKSNVFRIAWLAICMFWTVLKLRPDVVISTGAAPGFFGIVFGRIFGAKTIWVDSLANYQKLSRSGKYAKPFCSIFLTQWPDIDAGKNVQYWGNLL
jgi:UDP-N-acetylglucosamine:LPS N-acetylglucosamine transferase